MNKKNAFLYLGHGIKDNVTLSEEIEKIMDVAIIENYNVVGLYANTLPLEEKNDLTEIVTMAHIHNAEVLLISKSKAVARTPLDMIRIVFLAGEFNIEVQSVIGGKLSERVFNELKR